MRSRSIRPSTLFAAAGAAMALASVAHAQPYVINISGATLQEGFFNVGQSTNDFIGVDGERADTRSIREGFTTFGQLQLAGSATSTLPTSTGGAFRTFAGTGLIPWWVVQYRGVGSGNGLSELANYGFTGTSLVTNIPITNADFAYCNAVRHVLTGASTNAITNAANPSGWPCRGNGPIAVGNRYLASPFTLPVDGASSGTALIDIAPVDVLTDWFVGLPGTPNFDTKPAAGGYGLNPRTAVNTDGTPALYTYPGTVVAVPFRNSIATLPAGVKTFAQATAPGGGGVNSQTIFQTPTVYVPIAAVVNFGVGKSEATMSELRHLFSTGRMPSGENLTAITRDVGSGTRNAFMSSLHLDTSWGVGENVGPLNNLASFDAVGEGTTVISSLVTAGKYAPSNKGGSGTLENAVTYSRLGVGQTGAERGNGSWLTAARLELLGVKDDLTPGNLASRQYVRPTTTLVLNNGLIGETDPTTGLAYTQDGYRLGGPAVLATLGDPRNVAASKGGYGYNGLIEVNPGYPAMRNSEAAAYVNNITRSIDAFVTTGPDANAFSPAERLATTFILFGAVDRVQGATDPTTFAINTARNNTTETFTLGFGRLNNAAYTAFGVGSTNANLNPNGVVPLRLKRTAGTYSDGTDGSLGFKKVDGTFFGVPTVTAFVRLNSRNRISGDFDGNGLRNASDIPEMVAGWRFRNGSNPGWAPLAFTGTNNAGLSDGDGSGPSLCPEIIGDFNGDGSFNTLDVRYFADGLAIAVGGLKAGKLDRKDGFTQVDTAFADNFFGTTLATPCRDYNPGDSRGDVANVAGRYTPGFAPIGFDGAINATDIDYVYKQFKQNSRVTDGALDWDNTTEAIGADLSGDMNGDLVIDQADITELVVVVLKTKMGDANLDGNTNLSDRCLAEANLGLLGGWAMGDIDGNGIVQQADIDLIDAHLCLADVTVVGGPGACAVAGAKDGQLTVDDVIEFINAFGDGTGCPGAAPCSLADITGVGGAPSCPDGQLTVDDIIEFINAFSNGCN